MARVAAGSGAPTAGLNGRLWRWPLLLLSATLVVLSGACSGSSEPARPARRSSEHAATTAHGEVEAYLPLAERESPLILSEDDARATEELVPVLTAQADEPSPYIPIATLKGPLLHSPGAPHDLAGRSLAPGARAPGGHQVSGPVPAASPGPAASSSEIGSRPIAPIPTPAAASVRPGAPARPGAAVSASVAAPARSWRSTREC